MIKLYLFYCRKYLSKSFQSLILFLDEFRFKYIFSFVINCNYISPFIKEEILIFPSLILPYSVADQLHYKSYRLLYQKLS